MHITRQKICLLAASLAVTMTASATFNSAQATNGYFQSGYGASSKSLAGAGVALAMDSMAAATNPAAMVHVGERLDAEIGLFSPDRAVHGNGTTSGYFRSENQLFLIPGFGYNTMLDESSSLGFTLSANGGMNTEV